VPTYNSCAFEKAQEDKTAAQKATFFNYLV
jgi:hypothetical protein